MFEQMIKHRPPWLVTPPDSATIVKSTRIRLARNMSDIPFPNRCTPEQSKKVISRVLKAAQKTTLLKDADLINLESINQLD